jgi:hypothetical protein
LLAAAALYWFFPFPVSRAGSVVLMAALAYMIGKCREPGRSAQATSSPPLATSLRQELAGLDAQIALLQSAIYHVPFLTGANLFWMGLPGLGTSEEKALLDCVFLVATVLIFTGVFLLNQRTVRRRLLPLRTELESALAQREAPSSAIVPLNRPREAITYSPP